MNKLLLIPVQILLLLSCRNLKEDWISPNPDFRPPGGYIYVLTAGRSEDLGGLEEGDAGYLDRTGVPAGFVVDLSLPQCRDLEEHPFNAYRMETRFRDLILMVRLSPGDANERWSLSLNRGVYDGEIRNLGLWLRSWKRPVLLQVGGPRGPDDTADGESGAVGTADADRKALGRIIERVKELAPGRIATVWDTAGIPARRLDELRPADMDWIGLTLTAAAGERDNTEAVLELAAREGTPVAVGIPAVGEEYEKMLNHIRKNRAHIGALTLPAVLTEDAEFRKLWLKTLAEPGWIHRTLVQSPDSPDSPEEGLIND